MHKKIIGKFVIVQLKIDVFTLNVTNALLFVQSRPINICLRLGFA